MLLKGNLQGLQHIGIPVTDLERSKAFYARLGFVEVMRTDLSGAVDAIQVAMMQHGKLTLELYQLGQEERRTIAQRTDGHVDHIALDVLDIEQAYRDICAAGLKVLEDSAPVYLPFWKHGVRYFTFADPMEKRLSSIKS